MKQRDYGPTCMHGEGSDPKSKKLCGFPATTVRKVGDASLHVCKEHARTIDAHRDPSATATEPIDWSNRDVLRKFFAALTVAIDDALAVGADQLAPLRKRRLGPAEAKRLHAEAEGAIRALLDVAERGLVNGSRARKPRRLGAP